MGWTTAAICDRHWREQEGKRAPLRAIGIREHCYIEGCEQTGDIFVRAFLDTKEDMKYFDNPDHALYTGALVATLAKVGVVVELETDDDGQYLPSLIVPIRLVDWRTSRLRLRVELLPEEEDDDDDPEMGG